MTARRSLHEDQQQRNFCHQNHCVCRTKCVLEADWSWRQPVSARSWISEARYSGGKSVGLSWEDAQVQNNWFSHVCLGKWPLDWYVCMYACMCCTCADACVCVCTCMCACMCVCYTNWVFALWMVSNRCTWWRHVSRSHKAEFPHPDLRRKKSALSYWSVDSYCLDISIFYVHRIDTYMYTIQHASLA